jgi:tetratricopeptide (TPR) repeat protein
MLQLAEALSGNRLNKQGIIETTSLNRAQTIAQIRQDLNGQPDAADGVLWGRWLLADRATRTISPFSKVAVPEYIETRIKENTAASLAEAKMLAAGNPELSERIARAHSAPEQTNRAVRLKKEAVTPVGQGKLADAETKYREALETSRKVNGPEHPNTLNAMRNLANFYCSVGRDREAIALLEEASKLDPKNTSTLLTLATWQTWFGQDADYEVTRNRLVQQAEGTEQAWTAEQAAKVYCLRPSTDGALLAKALNLAHRAVELGKTTRFLPWYQLTLGLAEYRNGQYAAAERTLTIAEQTAGNLYDIPGTARLFRAMSLFRQDRTEEARKLFSETKAQMPPLPTDERKPLVDGQLANHDVLICWLAYKEAKSLLKGPAAAKP